MIKRTNILRIVAYVYLLAVIAAGFIFGSSLNSLNPMVMIFVIVFATLIFLKNNVLDLITGILTAAGSVYMLITISSGLFKVKTFTKTTVEYFCFGYGLFGLSLASAIFLMYYFYASGKTIKE